MSSVSRRSPAHGDPETMRKLGFEIVPAEDQSPLAQLREKVYRKAYELVGRGEKDPVSFFNSFHDAGIAGAKLNEVRLKLVEYCTANLGTGEAVFKAFRGYLLSLLGPDIAVQKTTNLVIQQPGDPDQVPTHRDAPLNSPFELVVWLPLVDCYKTKGMYLLEREKSAEATRLLVKPRPSYEEYSRFARKNGHELDVPFGHACFFWTGLVHGCEVNRENETRWSLNIRYKSLFAPYASKGLGDFYELLRLSPLSQLAFDFEKKAIRR